MLTFSSKGKACLKRLGGKVRVKKISSLPGESPSHSPSTLCLRADLLSTSLHASSLSSAPPLSVSLSHSSPLSADLASDSSLSPVSLPLVLGVTSSQNSQRKPGQMANLDPATLTCPDSRRSPGRRTPFVPPFGEGLLLPQPPQQTSPMVALGGSSTPLLTSPRAGVGGQRKASETVAWPASPESEAREATTALLPVCSVPMIVPPLAVMAQNSSAATATVTTQPLAAANVTALGTQWGPSFTSQGSATSWGSQRFPQPFMGGFPCYTQGQPVVPPAIHGWIPLPHPGTASGSPSHSWVDSPATPRDSQWFPQPFMGGFPCHTQGQQPLPPWWQPLSSMQQLATLGLPCSGSSGQDALLAGVGSSASLFWGTPGSPHRVSPPRRGRALDPGPSLSGSARQQAPLRLGSSLEQPDPIPPPRDHADPIPPPRDHAPESDNDSSQGSEWDGASEQGLDEPPADQQLWSLAASLVQLGEYAPSALVEGGEGRGCLCLRQQA